MIQKVLQIIMFLRELLPNNPAQRRDIRVPVIHQRLNLPYATINRPRVHRIRLLRIKRIPTIPILSPVVALLCARHTVDHVRACAVLLEQIVDERYNRYNCSRRCVQAQPCHALDKRRYQRRGKMCRLQEPFEQSEEPRPVPYMEQIRIQQRIKFCIKVRVIEVFCLYEVEQPIERQKRDGPSLIVALDQEVHQQLRFRERGHN